MITFSLSEVEAQQVIAVVTKMPIETHFNLFAKLQAQYQQAMQPTQPPALEKGAPA